jgi:hypothetical protein
MSFIGKNDDARVFAPGYFLASADCERKTYTMKQASAITTSSNNKIVKGGTVYPANDSTAAGIVYEDIDVTSGDMPGSVVTKGTVYEDKLAETLDSAAKTALEAKGFVFMTSPAITRPFN